MPDLTQSLGGYDLGFLHIVAELWGVEFDTDEFTLGLETLVARLRDPQLVAEAIKSLPVDAQGAIEELLRNGGCIPWSLFKRRYGEVREMGPGRRDRELPYLDPISPAEILWYRAFIGRGFFDTPSGPEEFAFIPNDLFPLMSINQGLSTQIFGRAAMPAERKFKFLSSDQILDDTCTFLAALRLDLPGEEVPLSSYPQPYPPTPVSINALLATADLLDEDGLPKPENARLFLESGRQAGLVQLSLAWQRSETFNELALIPHLILEGEWTNDPLHTRRSILNFVSNVPKETWWNLESFIAAIHQLHPDFQRPAGDYDSWFIRDRQSGEYLRGFEHWEQVDGQLLRFMITGPLHWLGILDLASLADHQPVTAFRYSKWSQALLEGEAPKGFPLEDQKIKVTSEARLSLSTRVPRAVRYQIARFSAWEGVKRGIYCYRVTPASLERARLGGLRTSQLLSLLRTHAEVVPPNLVKALERWDEYGSQARLENVLVLRLSSPEILKKLLATRAARFLGDPLGPTTVIVKPGAREKVLAALAELGYLGEIVSQDYNLRKIDNSP
jgi:hypothetical protein